MTNVQHGNYRGCLPQLDGETLLTDGGLETTLIFHEGFELPMFAAFTLLESERGRAALRAYYDRYVSLALRDGNGFILESPTWRANPDWGAKLGYGRDRLAEANRAGIEMMRKIRAAQATRKSPLVISGCIGPRGDGYAPGVPMRADDAQDYHAWQIGVLQDAGADLISAFTLTNIGEAVGVACAAKATGIPCVISFTLETDGRLPTGESLATGDRDGRSRNVSGAGLLHDQLRASRSLPPRLGRGCRLDAARARHQGQRFTQEPCGARQFHRARCGSSAATRRAIRGAAPPLPADQCSGRMLRHRPTSCGMHLGVVPRRIAWSCRRVGNSAGATSADKWGAAKLGAPLIRESLLAFRHGEHRSFGFAKRRVFSQHLILRHIAGL